MTKDPAADWPETISAPSFQKAVLNWFQENARDLPWRKTSDPYKIWISEVMLQQTQVSTVIPYWNRFIESFPSVSSLAEAAEAEVLKHWEGLGYYRRARQLHAAAKEVVERFEGEFPCDFQSVLSLPGIGRYTASAVLSISKNSPLPILEGNTIRLFSRLSGLRSDPTTSKNQKLLWQISENVVSTELTGSFNQGLMEIGALICTQADPNCSNCPVKRFCRAKKEELQTQIPAPKEKKIKYVPVCHTAVAIERNKKFLLRKCQKGEFFEGLWDFPRIDVTSQLPTDDKKNTIDLVKTKSDPASAVTAASEITAWCEENLGLELLPQLPPAFYRHAVTKYRILLLSFHCTDPKGPLSPAAKKNGWKWFDLKQIAELPLSMTGRKIYSNLSK